MARPTTKTRLADLRPEAVGREAHELVLRQAERLATKIGCSLSSVGPSDLQLTAADLCRYAQTGDTADWGDESGALDAAQSLCEVLYSQAGVPGTFDVGELGEDVDPETPVGLVLAAALARFELGQGEPVTARQLGALAGLDERHVRLLARNGELALGGTVKAEEARRWLSGRGVAGFEPRRRKPKA